MSTGSQRSSLQRVTGRAVISGHVLKIIRESLPATQEGLAEQLSVDVHTVQGWESGRRPLTATSVANLMRLRQRLRHLGARPELLDGLTDAIDADCFLDFVLDTNPELLQPGDHPLATWVMKRSFHQMVAWPVLGTKPSALRLLHTPARRRGPVSETPVLTKTEKARLFESLRTVIERSYATGTSAIDSEQAQLLRRQAYFLASIDGSPGMRDWLSQMASGEDRLLPDVGSWSPAWVTARSLTMAWARVGDPEPLRWFIDHALASEEGHRADLNYWAYWLGQIPQSYHADTFMVDRAVTWHGLPLLRKLSQILHPSQATVDIYIHSICALLRDQPHILQAEPGVAAQLCDRAAEMIDHQSDMWPQSRRKIESLYYGLQLMQPSLKTARSLEVRPDAR